MSKEYKIHDFGYLDPEVDFKWKMNFLIKEVKKGIKENGFKLLEIIPMENEDWISYSDTIDYKKRGGGAAHINMRQGDLLNSNRQNYLYTLLVEFYRTKYFLHGMFSDLDYPIYTPKHEDLLTMQTIQYYFGKDIEKFAENSLVYRLSREIKRVRYFDAIYKEAEKEYLRLKEEFLKTNKCAFCSFEHKCENHKKKKRWRR